MSLMKTTILLHRYRGFFSPLQVYAAKYIDYAITSLTELTYTTCT